MFKKLHTSFFVLVNLISLSALASAAGSDEKQVAYQVNVEAFPAVKALLDTNQVAAAIELLDTYLPQHENNPQYFNLLGVLYLQLKNYAHAAAAFERVVLIQSDNAGAWLDLAMANADAGNVNLAAQFFDYIEVQFTPTASVSELIASYRQRIAQQKRNFNGWRVSTDFLVGRDSNANSGLLDHQIAVTYQGKVIELPLDLNYRARADTFRQAMLNVHYRAQWGEQNVDLGASVVDKRFTKEHAFSYTDFATSLALSRKMGLVDGGVAANTEHFMLGDRSLLNNSGISFFVERSVASCYLNYALESEQRQYLNSPNLNGKTLWSNLASSCYANTAIGKVQSSLVYRIGSDKPIAVRPGGKTARHELIAKIALETYKAWRFEFSLNYALASDAEGYSVLLENNAPRRMQRHSARLQISRNLGHEWQFVSNLEKNKNDANLSLFRQHGTSFSVGLRKAY